MIQRKSTRLKEFDYSAPGAYFVTVCTHKRFNHFGFINVGQGLAPAEMILSSFGKIANEQIYILSERFHQVYIDKFVIMPNHIHMIIRLEPSGASPCPTISDIICAYKSLTTRYCRQAGFNEKHLFQTSFHDHIIRNREDYLSVWKYIDENPDKWQSDDYFCAD